MGALDFLKDFRDRAIDAASYKLLERNFQMQEENNRLLKDKAELLQEENLKLKAESSSLHAKVQALTERLSDAEKASEYRTEDGIAFRRTADGSFEETPYCPNCRTVMGNAIRLVYTCSKCGYNKKVRVLPEVVARRLNSQVQGNE